jgi:hypothetical protein
MQLKHTALVSALLMAAAVSHAQQPATAPAPMKAPAPAATAPAPAPQVLDAAGAADVTTVTAKIESINRKTRMVTLRGPMGKVVTIHAGPEVKNFDQIKKGDNLVVKYVEAVSIALDKNIVGRSETVTTTGPVSAPVGGKPGVAEAKQTRIVANVDRVDTATNHILVQGPKGRYVEVKVKNPDLMKTIKAGDKIVVTYTEAVLLDVQAAK